MLTSSQHRTSILGIRHTTASLLVLAIALSAGFILTQSAQAQTFTVLHKFTGTPDGASPSAPLITVNESVYGTTTNGGAFGYGTVFKVGRNGSEVVLHSFDNTDGAYPLGGLVRDKAGNFYGTTYEGGAFGDGTVFKLDPNGSESVLHSFTYGTDGGNPSSGLVIDSTGNLYGTASQAGALGWGTIFKLDASNVFTILHSFAGPPTDGGDPIGNLIMDSAGNLYGTTYRGGAFGAGNGTVFELDTSNNETILYSFANEESPASSLFRDKKGNLYGTTPYGGDFDRGMVFKLDQDGILTVLRSFTEGHGGGTPVSNLVLNKSGNLMGTSQGGNGEAYGTVFAISPAGKLTILHYFDYADGAYPRAGLVKDASGNFYGTAQQGASAGTVFKLSP
jgi:uncharacterized repeat protein (TIGR03803 family)